MPLHILESISLGDLTTFRIGGPARFFCEVTTEAELVEALSFSEKECAGCFFILGGGSNILVSDKGFDGLVISMKISGIAFSDTDSDTEITAGAGVIWDDLVKYSVDKGLYGLENLSWIPGTVGAAPVQNIGAYGVEVGSYVRSVRVYDTAEKKNINLSGEECNFSYRESIFKKEKKLQGQSRYIITSVTFLLSKKELLHTEYKDIQLYFKKNTIENPRLENMRDAIISIRKNKLPDIKNVGTAGSFFKNPVISNEEYQRLQVLFPEMPGFVEKNGSVKIPIAWVIDNVCGYRDFSTGSVGTYKNQALVIVNNGGATFAEVSMFAHEIILKVKEMTGISIEPEVCYVD